MRKILHQPLAMRNANDHLMARRKVKSHSNFLFKGLQLTISHKRPLLRRAHYRLVKQIPHHSAPNGHQGEEEQSTSRPYWLWCALEGAIQTRPHIKPVDYMKESWLWAEDSRFYTKVWAFDDMKDSRSRAQGSRYYEQLKVVVDMNDFELWA